MPFKLFLFLEGNDDARFFNQILVPLFRTKYSRVKTIKYAEMKPSLRRRMLQLIQRSGADYILVQDLHSSLCVTASKQATLDLLNGAITATDIAVVVKEIECWYLCGLDQNCCKRVLGKQVRNTHEFTKREFDHLIPKRMPRVEFMMRILEQFDIETGKSNNVSFTYFINKWVPIG